MEQVSSVAPKNPIKKSPKDFIFGKLLGEGSFSNVLLAKEVKNGKEFAIKICEKRHIIREKKTEYIQREKQVMAILSANPSKVAPYFVYLYATFQDTANLYFVMTYAHNGDMLTLLNECKTFGLQMARFYIAEIVMGLIHLHGLNIVHRDLKPENILLSKSGHILISDFGSSKILQPGAQEKEPKPVEVLVEDNNSSVSSKKRNSFVGTAQYVSPEVLNGDAIGPAADLWALGCILYQMVTGDLLFSGPNDYLIFQKILKGNFGTPSSLPVEVKSLVESLVKQDPLERLGNVDEVKYTSIQSHEFFFDVAFEQLPEQDPFKLWPSEIVQSNQKGRYEFPANLEPGYEAHMLAQRLFESTEDSAQLPDEVLQDDISVPSSNGDCKMEPSSPNSVQKPLNDCSRKETGSVDKSKTNSKKCICV